MEEYLHKCKCGHTPEIYVLARRVEPNYQGLVECHECGERVYGALWCWDRDHAAEDAVEEWNKAMPEEEDDDEG